MKIQTNLLEGNNRFCNINKHFFTVYKIKYETDDDVKTFM